MKGFQVWTASFGSGSDRTNALCTYVSGCWWHGFANCDSCPSCKVCSPKKGKQQVEQPGLKPQAFQTRVCEQRCKRGSWAVRKAVRKAVRQAARKAVRFVESCAVVQPDLGWLLHALLLLLSSSLLLSSLLLAEDSSIVVVVVAAAVADDAVDKGIVGIVAGMPGVVAGQFWQSGFLKQVVRECGLLISQRQE